MLSANIDQYNQAQEYINTKDLSTQLMRINESILVNNLDQLSTYLRRYDDKKGLVSGTGGGKHLANCSGARFRTEAFMNININDRSGAKKDKLEPIGVHIEHSVPVKCKRDILLSNLGTDIDKLLSTIGIAVAMTRIEEHNVIIKGFASAHPDVRDLNELDILSIRPFARYKDDTVIWDMKTGAKVDLNVTLNDLV